MAGLLKPDAASLLIKALKSTTDLPLHLHTHDTSSIQSATYLRAVEAGVDVIDVAMSSMSGLTSQPNFNSVVAMLENNKRANPIDLSSLNQYANFWEATRDYYYPFETELKAGTAEVYDNEIPGGQYSNLRPQARGLGLENKFESIKENYRIVNELLGGIVKVTPSSKVVGDMAMFMTANGLSKEDILEKGSSLSFPDSIKNLMRGDLGQIKGGFPKKLQALILKDEKPYKNKPNAHLAPIDFDKEFKAFKRKFGRFVDFKDFLSYQLYPAVFTNYQKHFEEFGTVRTIPTPAFFFGLKPNEEILIEIGKGKRILVQLVNMSSPDKAGMRTVLFKLNGQTRSIVLKDESIKSSVAVNKKVEHSQHIGASLQGNLSKILVKQGDMVKANTPLFIVEAMKMESTITSPTAGEITKIYLKERTIVEADDAVLKVE